jgi:hypothetical protein
LEIKNNLYQPDQQQPQPPGMRMNLMHWHVQMWLIIVDGDDNDDFIVVDEDEVNNDNNNINVNNNSMIQLLESASSECSEEEEDVDKTNNNIAYASLSAANDIVTAARDTVVNGADCATNDNNNNNNNNNSSRNNNIRGARTDHFSEATLRVTRDKITAVYAVSVIVINNKFTEGIDDDDSEDSNASDDDFVHDKEYQKEFNEETRLEKNDGLVVDEDQADVFGNDLQQLVQDPTDRPELKNIRLRPRINGRVVALSHKTEECGNIKRRKKKGIASFDNNIPTEPKPCCVCSGAIVHLLK